MIYPRPGWQQIGDRYRHIGMGMAASDAACVCVALTVAHYVRFGLGPLPAKQTLVIALSPPVWVVVFHAFELYAPQHLPAPEEFRRTVGAAGVGVVVLAMVSFWSKSSFSRIWVGMTWCLALLLELLTRLAWRRYQAYLKRDGRLAFRTLVVGTTGEALRLAETLGTPGSGFLPLGYVHPAGFGISQGVSPVLGDVDHLSKLIHDQAADCLFVASTVVGPEDVARVARVARQEDVAVRVSVNVTGTFTWRLALQQIGPRLALSLRPVRLTGAQAVVKRVFDVVVGSVALLLSAPLCVIVAIAIRLTSRGPVLFHQERVTKGGRTFRMHKFRTMSTTAAQLGEASTPFFKLDRDPRITGLGRLLRSFSVDELPQLWNVVKGEMSLVGPRPLPSEQVASNLDLLGLRHEVPAGVTGWWQINGRSTVTPEEAVRLDLFYIENWSLALDLYILLKTVGTVIDRKGAH